MTSIWRLWCPVSHTDLEPPLAFETSPHQSSWVPAEAGIWGWVEQLPREDKIIIALIVSDYGQHRNFLQDPAYGVAPYARAGFVAYFKNHLSDYFDETERERIVERIWNALE